MGENERIKRRRRAGVCHARLRGAFRFAIVAKLTGNQFASTINQISEEATTTTPRTFPIEGPGTRYKRLLLLTERESFATSGGVETAIKEAARKAAGSDPSLDVSKRITLEHLNRFLGRIFSDGEITSVISLGRFCRQTAVFIILDTLGSHPPPIT